jgi:hypothetical protein
MMLESPEDFGHRSLVTLPYPWQGFWSYARDQYYWRAEFDIGLLDAVSRTGLADAMIIPLSAENVDAPHAASGQLEVST